MPVASVLKQIETRLLRSRSQVQPGNEKPRLCLKVQDVKIETRLLEEVGFLGAIRADAHAAREADAIAIANRNNREHKNRSLSLHDKIGSREDRIAS
jgi:hypothetical protein